jgi:hypothetical protein
MGFQNLLKQLVRAKCVWCSCKLTAYVMENEETGENEIKGEPGSREN